MKKLTVVFSSYDSIDNPFYGGGGAHAVHQIASRLTQYFDVKVLFGKYHGSAASVRDGVTYEPIGVSLPNPKISQLLYHFVLPFYVKRTAHDIWVESFTPPFSTSFTPLFTNKPVVGWVHMLSSQDMRRKYKLPFHLVENLGLKMYSYFFVLTSASRKKIEKINSNAQIIHIPIGINIPTLNNKVKRFPGKYLVFLGRIEYNQKGLDLLIEAFEKFSRETDFQLIIAGSGNDRDIKLLNNRISQSTACEKIRYIGKVTGKNKENLLNSAHLVVIPSRFETFSLVALESMAYGIPLVGFDIEGLAWIPSSAMVKVRPFDVDALAQKLRHVLDDTSAYAQLSRSGKQIAKRHQWDTIAVQYHRNLLKMIHS